MSPNDPRAAAFAALHRSRPGFVMPNAWDAGSALVLAAGVTRISLGGSIARAALGFVRRCAQELCHAGSIGFAAGQIPQPERNALFARSRLARPRASNP